LFKIKLTFVNEDKFKLIMVQYLFYTLLLFNNILLRIPITLMKDKIYYLFFIVLSIFSFSAMLFFPLFLFSGIFYVELVFLNTFYTLASKHRFVTHHIWVLKSGTLFIRRETV
jgi:hypothetical protein